MSFFLTAKNIELSEQSQSKQVHPDLEWVSVTRQLDRA
jgi:hypothetical protein